MFHKILAPLDGSQLAEKALPHVEALAQKFNAAVILGWVIQTPVPPVAEYGPEPYMSSFFDTAAETERARAYLGRLQEKLHQRQIRSAIRVVENMSIADAIVAMAMEDKVDLIVKTTYGRLGLRRWLHGNIAAEVVQRAPCPVFLIRVSDRPSNEPT